ncbi:MAG: hypothetical protein HPY66_1710 [Firmicutes bacterium]|nr:hypothetical protein [Bacillota bacterium]
MDKQFDITKFDVDKSIAAQKEYCEQKGAPHFAPYDGRCHCCKNNIYKPLGYKRGQSASWIGRTGYRSVENCLLEEADYISGITVEKAGKELVTGCPHCNRSYCD